jgi:hypothetical protein
MQHNMGECVLKILNKTYWLLLTSIILIGVTGCMNILNKDSHTYIKDSLLQHLSEKYNGQEFIELSTENGLRETLHCYPKGGDPELDNVMVQRYEDADGNVITFDTYFGIVIREDLEKSIVSICSNLGFDALAFSINSSIQGYDEKYDGNCTFADLKRDLDNGAENRFDVQIFISSSDNIDIEKTADEITKALVDNNLPGAYGIAFIAPTDMNKITRSSNVKEIKFDKCEYTYRITD